MILTFSSRSFENFKVGGGSGALPPPPATPLREGAESFKVLFFCIMVGGKERDPVF